MTADTTVAQAIESHKEWGAYVRKLNVDKAKWREHGRCVDLPRGAMYPPRADKQQAIAESVCKGCYTQIECLYFALVNKEDFGVWGGTTETERAAMQQKIIEQGFGNFKAHWTDETKVAIVKICKDKYEELNQKDILETQA